MTQTYLAFLILFKTLSQQHGEPQPNPDYDPAEEEPLTGPNVQQLSSDQRQLPNQNFSGAQSQAQQPLGINPICAQKAEFISEDGSSGKLHKCSKKLRKQACIKDYLNKLCDCTVGRSAHQSSCTYAFPKSLMDKLKRKTNCTQVVGQCHILISVTDTSVFKKAQYTLAISGTNTQVTV